MAPSPGGRREEVEVKEGRRVTIQPSQEQVPAGVSAEDERYARKLAFAAMFVLSLIAAVAMILNENPFAISFNLSLVFIPTVVLFLGLVLTKG